MTRYILDNADPAELERLRRVEATLDPGTIRHLEALGVTTGWRCLEVGGGGGSITRWLCERVGSTGAVLATDLDPRHLLGIDAPNLKVRRHDVLADDLPDAAFDLVHVRWVLHHLPEPRQALARMGAALAPGGWLLAEELDTGTFTPAPMADAATAALLARMPQALNALLALRGASHFYGRRLLEDVRATGLEAIDADGRVAVITGGGPASYIWSRTLVALRGGLVEHGLLSEAEIDTLIAICEDPRFTAIGHTTVAVWGRRPAG